MEKSKANCGTDPNKNTKDKGLTDLKPQGSFVCTSGVLLWGTLDDILEAKTKLDDSKYDGQSTLDTPSDDDDDRRSAVEHNFKCHAAKGQWVRYTTTVDGGKGKRRRRRKGKQIKDNGRIGLFCHADSMTPDQLMKVGCQVSSRKLTKVGCRGHVGFAWKPVDASITKVVLTDPSWSMTMPEYDEDCVFDRSDKSLEAGDEVYETEEETESSDDSITEEDMEEAELIRATNYYDLLCERQTDMADLLKTNYGDYKPSEAANLDHLDLEEDKDYAHFLDHIKSDTICSSDPELRIPEKKDCRCESCQSCCYEFDCEECEGTGRNDEKLLVDKMKAKFDKGDKAYLLKDANDQVCGIMCEEPKEMGDMCDKAGVCARLIFNDKKELIGMKYQEMNDDDWDGSLGEEVMFDMFEDLKYTDPEAYYNPDFLLDSDY